MVDNIIKNVKIMMTKVQKLNAVVSPFAGVSFVNNLFKKSGLDELIDNELGVRGEFVGYQYSEIIRNLANVFFAGGDHIEDINNEHLREHLAMIPDNNVPSPDTVLRGIKELAVENTNYVSDSGISYNFNINNRLNRLNIKSLLLTGQLQSGKYYDFDYDNQILANEKYDAKRTYKKNQGYFPGVATIGNKIIYIENRDGNANVKFKQAQTLSNAFKLLAEEGILVNRSRMDAGSYAQESVDVIDINSRLFYIRANKSANLFEQIKKVTEWQTVEIGYKEYQVASIPFIQFFKDRNYRLVIMRETGKSNQMDAFTQDNFIYRTILTNDHKSTEKEVIEYYNQRGSSEKIFDIMNNDFAWKHLPFSFLNENAAFMIIMAMIKNFYNFVLERISKVFTNITTSTRLKRFIFRFISVAGKWVFQGRRWILKLYSNRPYERLNI